MSKHEFIIAFDCGGIFANDIPVDMFKKLAKDRYPEQDQTRVADIHARNRDLWNRFKQEAGYSEQTYFETVIEREKLNESVDELKQRLRDSVVCYQHVREVAVALHEQGYALAIMSNHSNEWFDFIASTFKFSEFCPPNRTIVSQAVLCAKPSVAIMEKLYEAITKDFPGHEKGKIVFVDDTEANCTAAISYGFKSFVYDARLQTADDLWQSLAEYGVKRA
jgi:FMN phosphatase YigB (HAD superfamily)